jgi:hypothetical protein
MKRHLTNILVFVTTVMCCGFAKPGVILDANTNKWEENQGGKQAANVNDTNGPTVILSYSGQASQKNPFDSFMYFVPLVSLTDVNIEVSANNDQQVGTISYERKTLSKSFYASCVFEMTGNGFHKYIFDPAQVIALHAQGAAKSETLEHLIDYIEFSGPGFGCVIVKGKISGSIQTVDEVRLQFNARGHKSPVIIGLYDVPPIDGQYKYHNRTNEMSARVDTFIFKNTAENPRMGIKLASVGSSKKSNDFLAGIKGAIANLFINPPKVARLGNDTMLDFGLALLSKKSFFTFPKADNIKKVTQESTTNN